MLKDNKLQFQQSGQKNPSENKKLWKHRKVIIIPYTRDDQFLGNASIFFNTWNKHLLKALKQLIKNYVQQKCKTNRHSVQVQDCHLHNFSLHETEIATWPRHRYVQPPGLGTGMFKTPSNFCYLLLLCQRATIHHPGQQHQGNVSLLFQLDNAAGCACCQGILC